MADIDAFEAEVWKNILDYLDIEEDEVPGADRDFRLFGEESFLDSIDALEIEIMVKEKYGIAIQTSERNRSTFGDFGILCDFIRSNRDRDKEALGGASADAS